MVVFWAVGTVTSSALGSTDDFKVTSVLVESAAQATHHVLSARGLTIQNLLVAL